MKTKRKGGEKEIGGLWEVMGGGGWLVISPVDSLGNTPTLK